MTITRESESNEVTRERIIEFIRSNPDRTNPGAKMTAFWHAAQYSTPMLVTGNCDYALVEDLGSHKSNPRPSCVIGHVLYNSGVNLNNVAGCGTADELVDYINIDFDVALFANRIQKRADRGYTWGTALACALLEEENDNK